MSPRLSIFHTPALSQMTTKTTSLIELPSDLDCTQLPQHIAVIMDGNGRWAKKRGFPRVMGHRRGADTLRDLLRCCKDWGIEALSNAELSTYSPTLHFPAINLAPDTSSSLRVERMTLTSGLLKI